jgi:hypothetical protein
MNHRRGFILILVAGVCVLVAGLILTFVARMRSDAADNQVLVRQTQARLMLAAACAYILEAGRIGHETDTYNSSTGLPIGLPAHEEAFGWVDVRDGSLGPKRSVSDPSNVFAPGPSGSPGVFPRIGGRALRCPMAVRQRPPFAIAAEQAPNAINTDPAAPAFGLPLLLRPDPQPVGMDATTFAVDAADFRTGDPRLRPVTVNLSWFRVYRDGPATFTITCGAGATHGFKDWAEMSPTERQTYFGGDDSAGESLFSQMLQNEVRLWYRVEWNAAIGHALSMPDGFNDAVDNYNPGSFTAGRYTRLDFSYSLLPSSLNAAGTIQWIQRLRAPPLNW